MSAVLYVSVVYPKKTQALEDPKRPLNKTYLGLLASQPPGSLHPDFPSHSIMGLPANTPPQRSSLMRGFRCSWPYLNFNKGLIKMFSSLKCTGIEFRWWNDRLCVGLIGWVRDITPGWRGELSETGAVQQAVGCCHWGNSSGEWLTFRWVLGTALDGGGLKAGRRILGEAKETAPQKHSIC